MKATKPQARPVPHKLQLLLALGFAVLLPVLFQLIIPAIGLPAGDKNNLGGAVADALGILLLGGLAYGATVIVAAWKFGWHNAVLGFGTALVYELIGGNLATVANNNTWVTLFCLIGWLFTFNLILYVIWLAIKSLRLHWALGLLILAVVGASLAQISHRVSVPLAATSSVNHEITNVGINLYLPSGGASTYKSFDYFEANDTYAHGVHYSDPAYFELNFAESFSLEEYRDDTNFDPPDDCNIAQNVQTAYPCQQIGSTSSDDEVWFYQGVYRSEDRYYVLTGNTVIVLVPGASGLTQSQIITLLGSLSPITYDQLAAKDPSSAAVTKDKLAK